MTVLFLCTNAYSKRTTQRIFLIGSFNLLQCWRCMWGRIPGFTGQSRPLALLLSNFTHALTHGFNICKAIISRCLLSKMTNICEHASHYFVTCPYLCENIDTSNAPFNMKTLTIVIGWPTLHTSVSMLATIKRSLDLTIADHHACLCISRFLNK